MPIDDLEKVDSKFGKSFPLPAVFVGYLFSALGFISIITGNLIIGAIVFTIGTFAAFTSSGILLDPARSNYKVYSKYFGIIKSGSWESLDGFPCISVLRSRKSSTTHNYGVSRSDTETSYEITFLSKNHRNKLVFKSVEDPDIAIKEARDIADYIGKELVKFNPKVTSRKRR